MRTDGRATDQMRPIHIQAEVNKHAEGSCLVQCGDTHVLCTASIEERVPPWLRNTGHGWITAEYGMLPRSTGDRSRREAAVGKQGGRTQEIQRLIGRALRSIADLKIIGERQIILDCDVIQADGGTRTASITGAYVALHHACTLLVKTGAIRRMPLTSFVAAVSCGIHQDQPLLDLNYEEDSTAAVDANFVLTEKGGIVEIQTTAEDKPFLEDQLTAMLKLARKGIDQLITAQRSACALD